jgi:hypothetical protein
MKVLVLAFAMMMTAGAYANGGPGHGPVNTVPPFDGTYAPGFGPNSGVGSIPTVCGARTPCPQPVQPYTGCTEGAQAVVTVPTGTFNGRTQGSETAVFVCHSNDWVRVN